MLCMIFPPEAWQDAELLSITYHDAFAPKRDSEPAVHCWFLKLIDLVNIKQEKKRASTSSLHSIRSHH